MTRRTRASVSVVILVLAACSGNEAPSDAGLVARAANQTWTVEEAAALIAPDSALPAEPEAVRTIANLWIDYTLLATAVARDSTLSQIDVSPVVNDLARQQLLAALRDSVITVEPLTDQELQERYRSEATGSLVRARQILLTWPEGAPQAARDSVRQAIEAVRARIVDGGEDFGAVAQEVSQTPGGLPGGWDLGVVRRGQLEASVDSALFALSPGAVSQPVVSPYGVHLLQVQERLTPSVEQFRAELMDRRMVAAESVYVAGLEAQAEPEILEGAAERVRAMARHWRRPLPEREETRPLLRYAGGSVTQGEVLWYLQSQPPILRARVAASRDDKIPDDVLTIVAHQELLLADALRRGWTSPAEARARVADAARRNLVEAARQLGLLGYDVAPDTHPSEAVRGAVNKLLSDILSGERREITPLGVMAYVLRRRFPARIVEPGVGETVQQIHALRSGDTSGGDGA
jgi:hypothetical protein